MGMLFMKRCQPATRYSSATRLPGEILVEMKAGWDLALNEKDKFKAAIKQAVAWNQEEYDEWSKNAAMLAEKSVDIPRLFEKYMNYSVDFG